MIAVAGNRNGGKSELRRAGWSLTATGGNPKESATENIPPLRFRKGKGEKARQELTSFPGDRESLVNPIRSKTK